MAHRTTTTGSLAQLARTRGLNRGQAVWRPSGWLVRERVVKAPLDGEPLSLHADWVGPTKLVAAGGAWRQRTEVFLPQSAGDAFLDREADAAQERLLAELLDGSFSSEPTTPALGWEPPEAQALAGWLADAGCTPAIDEQQNLRFALGSRGSDGQVRVLRQHGRLRMSLALGAWNGVDPAAESAMLRLASEANARGRLARIVWHAEGDARCCEARVDLSGLPLGSGDSTAHGTLWREMTRLAVAGLELALRRLGLELDVLSDVEFSRSLMELDGKGSSASVARPPHGERRTPSIAAEN